MSRAVSSAPSPETLQLDDAATLALASLLVQPDAAQQLAAAIALIDTATQLRFWCLRNAGPGEPDLTAATSELADWLVSSGWKLLAAGQPFTSSPLLQHTAQQQLRLQILETQFAAELEAERLRAIKELAYGASHEVNNPLANISSRAQTLLTGEADPGRRAQLATINVQAFRAHEMISSLMLFANPPALDPEQINVADVTAQVLQELAPRAEAQQTELKSSTANQQQTIFADRYHLAVAVKSLIENALEAVQDGGRIAVTTTYDSQDCHISVTDTGPGVPPAVAARMFDPFYSGREAGRGLGFGLSKCWRIAQMHHGQLQYETTPSGATFKLSLPLAAPASSNDND